MKGINENAKPVFAHLGSIFFGIAFTGSIICATMMTSKLIGLLMGILALAVVIIVTFGTLGLGLIDAGVRGFLGDCIKFMRGEQIGTFISAIYTYFPIIASITGVLLVASAVCLFLDLKQPKIIIKFGLLILATILFIISIIAVPMMLGGAN